VQDRKIETTGLGYEERRVVLHSWRLTTSAGRALDTIIASNQDEFNHPPIHQLVRPVVIQEQDAAIRSVLRLSNLYADSTRNDLRTALRVVRDSLTRSPHNVSTVTLCQWLETRFTPDAREQPRRMHRESLNHYISFDSVNAGNLAPNGVFAQVLRVIVEAINDEHARAMPKPAPATELPCLQLSHDVDCKYLQPQVYPQGALHGAREVLPPARQQLETGAGRFRVPG
jgi:hypothetical protein